MRSLYHFALSAPSRVIRIALAEKGLDAQLRVEKVWERRPEFLGMSPSGEVPVLVETDGTTLTDVSVIAEYLDEVYADPPLIGTDPLSRAETRRLACWFGQKFAREVTDNLVGEKLMKRFLALGQPDSQAIRAGKANIHYHLEYIAYLSDTRNWLAGERLTLADIAAAAHLSVVDYLGDVPWSDHPKAKDWYSRIKCRPSVRPLLEDRIATAPPPPHYADLDF